MIPPCDQFGPWVPGLDAPELRARLRAMRALARVHCGPRATALCRLLAAAETDPAALEPACHALNAMASADRRAIWASYAALARSAA